MALEGHTTEKKVRKDRKSSVRPEMEATVVLLIRCNTHYERCSSLPVRVQIGSNVLNPLSCTKAKEKNSFQICSMIILGQIINGSAAGLLSKIQRCNQRTAIDRTPPPQAAIRWQTACNSLPSCKRKKKAPLNPKKQRNITHVFRDLFIITTLIFIFISPLLRPHIQPAS